jgi:hypothetical protein
MSRDELTLQAAAELAALDAIIDGEQVGEEHLELAALVDSVRAQAPAYTAASAQRVEARLAAARTPRPRRIAAARPRLALAGGTLFAAILALAVVLGSGVLGSGRSAPSPLVPRGAPTLHSLARTPAGASIGAGGGGQTSIGATGATGVTAAGGGQAAVGGSVGPQSLPVAGASPKAAKTLPNTNPGGRLVARNATLTLATPPGQMQTVASEIVSSTVRLGGIVESSSVNVHGMSSYASFSLSVPSGRLQALIGTLSSLAAVRALDQGTSDITDTYDAAAATLAEEKAQHTALLRALAAATTLASQQEIEAKIKALDGRIAGSSHRVGLLLERGHNARVSVAVVPVHAAASASSGPIKRALDDAESVLAVALAVALIALAILLPAGLVALLLWWGAVSVRQRSRERALALTR